VSMEEGSYYLSLTYNQQKKSVGFTTISVDGKAETYATSSSNGNGFLVQGDNLSDSLVKFHDSSDSIVIAISSTENELLIVENGDGTASALADTDNDGEFETEIAQSTVETHTVAFVDSVDEEIIATYTVEHGGNVQPPEPIAHEGYTFVGWEGDYRNVKTDKYVAAIYEKDVLAGDTNGDGVVNTGDAVLILRSVTGGEPLDETRLIAADMNNDGVVNTGDAVAILIAIVSPKRSQNLN
ncbi:MAG: hypothetical protein GX802_08015, partial [Clostridiales bacterium]|nr:hypothetical protein [Clostridiales bacterium]